jgi:hypothetical protein
MQLLHPESPLQKPWISSTKLVRWTKRQFISKLFCQIVLLKRSGKKKKKWKDRDKESTLWKAQQSRERNRCTEGRVLLVRVLHLPRLGNQNTKTPCTDAKMSSFVAAPHWNNTSMTNSTNIQYLVSRVFIDDCNCKQEFGRINSH